jgi:hypothetical protein
MDVKAAPAVNRPAPVRPQVRVEEGRASEQLAARRAEASAVDQRRQAEAANLRRAQASQADKGRNVDRYA